MYDIVSIGEALIDFRCDVSGQIKMIGSLGGATCNVLTQATKLGLNCCLISAVGNDVWGRYICNQLDKIGISHYIQSVDATTTLAIVTLDDYGDRSFDFVRSPGADSIIVYDEKIEQIVKNSKVIEYGSLSFSKEPAASTIFKALENATGLRAYDPNLRPAIWKDDAKMLAAALRGMEYADILKIGDEELVQITNITDMDEAVSYLRYKFDIQYVFVTMGEKGCKYYIKDKYGYVPSFNVNAVDTTGAGDSFFGAVLSGIIKSGCQDIADIENLVKFACAAGAITASNKGTAEAMPYEEEIINLLNNNLIK